MIFTTLLVLLSTVYADYNSTTTLETREKRSLTTYKLYYLCGNKLSFTPCKNNNNNNNNNNNKCSYRCSTHSYCRKFNSNWQCQNGCCKTRRNFVNTKTRQQPVCGGREVSGGYCRNNRCGSGFLCTSNKVCCRCAFGTSVGKCVNRKCPNNTRCNSNNECCPYRTNG